MVAAQRPPACQPKIEVAVFTSSQYRLFTEPPHTVYNVPAKHRRGNIGDDALAEERRIVIGGRFAPMERLRAIRFPEKTVITADPTNIRVLPKCVQTRVKMMRQEMIVGIEEDKKIPATLSNAVIARRCLTLVPLLHIPHAGIASDHPGRIVGRAVVDDDDFITRIGLGQHAVDRFRQKPGVIVRRDDHADQRTIGIEGGQCAGRRNPRLCSEDR